MSVTSSGEGESDSDEEYKGKLAEDDVSSIYKDWLNDMKRVDQQRIAMMLYDNYRTRFLLQKTAAAQEVARFLNISEKTVRTWRKQFLMINEDFGEDYRGKHLRYCVIKDEQFCDEAAEWVQLNNNITGKKNMTASDFSGWVNSTLLPKARETHPNLPSITDRTAVHWLHVLGFEIMSSKKGVYIDGHERSDVVDYRKIYLRRLEIISSCHAPPPLCAEEIPERCFGPHRKDAILLFHDESVFHSNDDQSWVWGEKGKQPIKPKGLGRGIMVSDFVDEYNGLLALTDEEFWRGKLQYPNLKQAARVLLKYGAESEGYWNSDKFIAQVKDVIYIVKVKYPEQFYDVYWFFDQSSGHTAFADDALNAKKMNVKPGGSQPKMRDTYWSGNLQRMVYRDGTPKGMKAILIERGVNVTKMKADEMRQVG